MYIFEQIILQHDTRHDDIQHNDTLKFSYNTQHIGPQYWHAQCHYADCRGADNLPSSKGKDQPSRSQISMAVW